jgi:uncharacterized cupredoxin-like copper-binding protein/predicted ester cyclase
MVLAALPAGAAGAQTTPPPAAAEETARQAIAAVNEAMATGETGAIDAVFAPDAVGHPPHRSLVTGEPFSHDVAGLKAGLDDIRLFFPDAAIGIDGLIASGDTVAARVTFRGTPDVAALGLGEETAQPMEIGGLMYGRITAGRVVEYWAYFDLSAYFDLIGLLPTAGMAAATPRADAPAGTEVIAATLGGGAGEFTIESSQTSFRVGVPYRFAVTNAGRVPHELMIVPVMPMGQLALIDPMPMEDMHEMALGLTDEDELPPGAAATLEITFTAPAPAGTLELACYLPGHYQAGMYFPIEVTP